MFNRPTDKQKDMTGQSEVAPPKSSHDGYKRRVDRKLLNVRTKNNKRCFPPKKTCMTYRWLFCFWKDASNEPIHAVEFTRKSEDCNKTHMRIKAIFAFFSTLLMSVPLFVVMTAYGSHTFRCRSISISHLFPPFMPYIRGTCTGCSLNIEFFLKMFWFFWTLSVLLQCWCLTCHCLHTLT